MHGTKPTDEEKRLWDKLAARGCIACRIDGIFQPLVSIHHIGGRTRPGCHRNVIPLCAGHHQDGTGGAWMIAVHPNKARFEKAYSNQELLNALVLAEAEEGRDISGALARLSGTCGPITEEDVPF